MPIDASGFDDGGAERPHSGVAASPSSLIGQTIDKRYRVEALLGEGGMGLVYRVIHTSLNKPLAIKVLRRENTHDEEVLARFRREAESASAIGNQHIVDINDFGVLDDGSTYFVMECLDGMDLIEAMDLAQRMPEERALHIAVQICKALGAAHDAGIVHRDLKPENVFLTARDGTPDFVKILDFGIAKVANGPTRLTRKGEVLGTPHYMSPEQCEGEDIDQRTDIYALGVLLYEMLTGHVPHDADTVMGILTKHLYEDPLPPATRVPQLSGELERVVMRCLEKNPERRYQTMRELGSDLSRIRSGDRPLGPVTVTLTPTRPPARRPRVRPVLVAGVVVSLLALAGTLVVTALGEGKQEPAPIGLAPTTDGPKDAAPTAPFETKPAEASQTDPAEASSAAMVDRPADRAQPPRRKPARRKHVTRGNAAPRDDSTILDPWK
jgi:serine/threonine-protein kinase